MGIVKTTGKALAKAPEAAADAARAAKPSPNPMTNLILADIALRSGGQLLRRAVEIGLLGKALGAKEAGKLVKGRSMGQTLVGTAIARIATRSVPGALIIGGGLLAKTLYDRKHAGAAKESGRKAIARQAKRGN